MEKLTAIKETKLFDSVTNEPIKTVPTGEPLGYKAAEPLKRKIGAVVCAVTEVYDYEVVKGRHVQRFYWFLP